MIKKQIVFKVIDYGFEMQAKVHFVGSDLLIEITGGSHPHIGTVTVFSKEESFESIRFHSEGDHYHKDDLLSDCFVKKLKGLLTGTCVITSGVHIDQITEEQKRGSLEMAERLAQKVKEWLENQELDFEEPKYQY